MDFKILAQFVMLAGLAVFGYGGYQYKNAEVKSNQQIKQASRQMGGFGAMIAGMGAQENQQHEQQEGKKLMGIGGGILFLGFALSAAAHGKKKEAEAVPKPAEDSSRDE